MIPYFRCWLCWGVINPKGSVFNLDLYSLFLVNKELLSLDLQLSANPLGISASPLRTGHSIVNPHFEASVLHCPAQGGITCGAIDEPRKSSEAIDKRVIIDFRDKNVVIARFRDINEVFI